jgi:hypothetical protein
VFVDFEECLAWLAWFRFKEEGCPAEEMAVETDSDDMAKDMVVPYLPLDTEYRLLRMEETTLAFTN